MSWQTQKVQGFSSRKKRVYTLTLHGGAPPRRFWCERGITLFFSLLYRAVFALSNMAATLTCRSNGSKHQCGVCERTSTAWHLIARPPLRTLRRSHLATERSLATASCSGPTDDCLGPGWIDNYRQRVCYLHPVAWRREDVEWNVNAVKGK